MRLIYLVITFSLLISCKKSGFNTSGKTVFRYNESSGITSLDPAFASNQANIWACNQIFNGLVSLNDSLIPEPCIAKSWIISDDGKLYTFNLKNDVYFHPDKSLRANRKVVAQDFVFSFNRLIDPKIASPGSWIFNFIEKDTIKNILNVKAENKTT